MVRPQFFKQPFDFVSWASREKPALFWSCALGLAGPAVATMAPYLRSKVGDEPTPPIPTTYPSKDAQYFKHIVSILADKVLNISSKKTVTLTRSILRSNAALTRLYVHVLFELSQTKLISVLFITTQRGMSMSLLRLASNSINIKSICRLAIE